MDRTAALAYDDAGRLLAEVQESGGVSKTVSYAYTQDSLIDAITYPSGRVLHQTYTTRRELDGVQLDGGAVASHVYDNAGRLTQRNYGNGKVANWTLDANSRVAEVDHVGVQKYGYTYSDEGDPLTQSDVTTPDNQEGYTYDGMHRLATMQRGPQGMPDFAQSWTLDKVGNWTSWNDNGTNETRTHNALNQLTQKGAATCVYDGKGNQIDDGEKFVMVYDPNNRFKEVRDRATQEVVVTCKYDALGRRVERNVQKPVEYQTGGLTRYYYAGQRIVEEYDGNALLQAVYTYGQYIDEPLSMDHVPTSQPTSQPASQPAAGGTGILPVTENTPTVTPEVMTSPTAAPEISPTVMATAVASATSAVNTPTATAVPTNTPDLLPTIPPDPYATQAMSLLTPVPTDTPVALQTSPPDPYATQAAQMTESSTPAPQATAAQVQSIPQVITSPTPTAIQVQILSTTSQPSLERYYYHANRLYSIAALTDSQGNVVERYQYNAYGLCTTFNANYELPLAFSRFGNPFTFTGRELDPETDLMHYRERTYSPKQGRFVQTDPVGYQGGINLYEYVGSRCLTGLDPNGLANIGWWPDNSDWEVWGWEAWVETEEGEDEAEECPVDDGQNGQGGENLPPKKPEKEKPKKPEKPERFIPKGEGWSLTELQQIKDAYQNAWDKNANRWDSTAAWTGDGFWGALYGLGGYGAQTRSNQYEHLVAGWVCYQWSHIVYKDLHALNLKHYTIARVAYINASGNFIHSWVTVTPGNQAMAAGPGVMHLDPHEVKFGTQTPLGPMIFSQPNYVNATGMIHISTDNPNNMAGGIKTGNGSFYQYGMTNGIAAQGNLISSGKNPPIGTRPVP